MCKIVVVDDIFDKMSEDDESSEDTVSKAITEAFKLFLQGFPHLCLKRGQLASEDLPDLYLVNAHYGQGHRSHFKGIDMVWEKIRFSPREQVRTIPIVLYSPMEEEFLRAYSIRKYGVDIFQLPSDRTLCKYIALQNLSALNDIVGELLKNAEPEDLADKVRQETYYPRLHRAFEKFRIQFRHAIRGPLDLLTHQNSDERKNALEKIENHFNDLGESLGLTTPLSATIPEDKGDEQGTAAFFYEFFREINECIGELHGLLGSLRKRLKIVKNQNRINQNVEELINIAQLWFILMRERKQTTNWLEDKFALILEDDFEIAKRHKEYLSKVFPFRKNIFLLVEDNISQIGTFNALRDFEERILKSISDDTMIDNPTANDLDYNALEGESRRKAFTKKLSKPFIMELGRRNSELSNTIRDYIESVEKFRKVLVQKRIARFSQLKPEYVTDVIHLIESLYDGEVVLVLIDVILHGDEEAGIEILRKLKMERPLTKYVVVTGRNDLQVKAFSYGADMYITKGTDLQELSSELKEDFLYQYKVAWLQDDKSACFDNHHIVAAEKFRLKDSEPEFNMAQVVCATKTYLQRRNILLKYYSRCQQSTQPLFDKCAKKLYLEIERNRFDVVLLDSFGEEEEHFKKGICYFKALKQLPSPPAVIMLIPAGYGILKSTIFRDLRDYFAVDYDDIWVKPLSIERLKELVSRLKQKSLLKYDVRYTLLLPKEDNEGNQVGFRVIKEYERTISERFGGQTIIDASGVWVSPEGKKMEDKQWMIQILTRYAPGNRQFLLGKIDEYGKKYKQEAIFLQEERLNTYEVKPLRS